jgi:hypothetical protein
LSVPSSHPATSFRGAHRRGVPVMVSKRNSPPRTNAQRGRALQRSPTWWVSYGAGSIALLNIHARAVRHLPQVASTDSCPSAVHMRTCSCAAASPLCSHGRGAPSPSQGEHAREPPYEVSVVAAPSHGERIRSPFVWAERPGTRLHPPQGFLRFVPGGPTQLHGERASPSR